jgi:uncharacterized protein
MLNLRHGGIGMNRDLAIRTLQDNADAIRQLGATALFLFGSAARDDMRPDSDIDVFIDYDPAGPFDFVALFGLKDLLEAKFNREVDVTTRAGLHPRLRERIEKSSVQVL